MTRPIISIVVSTYNRAARLRTALDSIAAQNWSEWECLVSDDGSTDGTSDLVRARCTVDPRFRLLTGPHVGWPAVPRNRGVAAATGEWIAFLDDDDSWHPKKLEWQIELALRHGCDAVSVTAANYVEPQLPAFPRSDAGAALRQVTLITLLAQADPYPHTSATMVKRAAILDVGGFPEAGAYRAVEDFDLWCRLLARPAFRWLMEQGDALVAYRDQGADSISAWNRVLDPDVIRQRWAVLESMTRAIAAAVVRGPERVAAWSSVVRCADECAGRCRAVGWPHAAAAGYALSALASIAIRQPTRASLAIYRASVSLSRFGRNRHDRRPIPDDVTPLIRRAIRCAVMIVVGRESRATTTPAGVAGRWSTLQQLGS